MALHETERFPAFRSDIRASGLAEVWTHTHDQLKFTQFGWRSTTKESSYSTNTLIGNWNQERYDVQNEVGTLKPLPSQHAHYFDTTCHTDYKNPNKGIEDARQKLRLLKTAGKEPRAYPGHQPELDVEAAKELYNSFMTTSRVGYVNPASRMQPMP